MIWNASAASPFWPKPPRWNGKPPASTSLTRPATQILAVKLNAFSAWWMAWFCWSMRQKAQCRKPNSLRPKLWLWACARSLCSTRWINPTPSPIVLWMNVLIYSPRLAPMMISLIFRICTPLAARVGQIMSLMGRVKISQPCLIWL